MNSVSPFSHGAADKIPLAGPFTKPPHVILTHKEKAPCVSKVDMQLMNSIPVAGMIIKELQDIPAPATASLGQPVQDAVQVLLPESEIGVPVNTHHPRSGKK